MNSQSTESFELARGLAQLVDNAELHVWLLPVYDPERDRRAEHPRAGVLERLRRLDSSESR